jgi:hypothetical protein
LKIRFDPQLNLTSAIGNFSKSHHLASYVSRHNAMVYDTVTWMGMAKVMRTAMATAMATVMTTGNGNCNSNGTATSMVM